MSDKKKREEYRQQRNKEQAQKLEEHIKFASGELFDEVECFLFLDIL